MAYNEKLADVYRYILQNKSRDLVLLRDEMEFLESYFLLLKIRFDNAVQLKITVNENALDQYLVPPISLQVLAENAIKHNEFSENFPLIISVVMNGEHVVIHNEIRKKILQRPSSRIGLQNLRERYVLTTNKEIILEETGKDFTVSLPVLQIS